MALLCPGWSIRCYLPPIRVTGPKVAPPVSVVSETSLLLTPLMLARFVRVKPAGAYDAVALQYLIFTSSPRQDRQDAGVEQRLIAWCLSRLTSMCGKAAQAILCST